MQTNANSYYSTIPLVRWSCLSPLGFFSAAGISKQILSKWTLMWEEGGVALKSLTVWSSGSMLPVFNSWILTEVIHIKQQKLFFSCLGPAGLSLSNSDKKCTHTVWQTFESSQNEYLVSLFQYMTTKLGFGLKATKARSVLGGYVKAMQRGLFQKANAERFDE